MGRDTTGVKGIELGEGDVIGMVVVKRDATLLVVTEKGIGKCSNDRRLPRAEARRQGHHHGQPHREDGRCRPIMEVLPDDELMLITKQGVADPHAGEGHPRQPGRNTQGVSCRRSRRSSCPWAGAD
jgi:DNA gyrase subunit A